MTYEQAQRNADIMAKIIKHNLITGGSGKIAYNACEPEVQALIRCQLTHSEKRALGIVADDEPDSLELALRAHAREREEERYGKSYDVSRRLKTTRARLYYDVLATA